MPELHELCSPIMLVNCRLHVEQVSDEETGDGPLTVFSSHYTVPRKYVLSMTVLTLPLHSVCFLLGSTDSHFFIMSCSLKEVHVWSTQYSRAYSDITTTTLNGQSH